MTQTAEALHQALSMPEAERQRRRAALAQAAAALPPTAWLQAQLDALDTVAEPSRAGQPGRAAGGISGGWPGCGPGRGSAGRYRVNRLASRCTQPRGDHLGQSHRAHSLPRR